MRRALRAVASPRFVVWEALALLVLILLIPIVP